MQVHRGLDQLPAFRNAVITIGTFDGVHKGHQEIIASLKETAAEVSGETVILTFHPHPRQVVRGAEERVALLTTLEEKIELLDRQGVDHLVVIPFTVEFSQMSAEEYVSEFLVRNFHPHTIIIGYDHRFGRNRSGDFRLLEELGAVLGFRVLEIPERVLDLLKVSSTRIREALLSGQPVEAAECLGYRYFFEGTVVRGQQIGRTLGFPTANIRVEDPEKLIPADGIYAVRVSFEGRELNAMMSIGFRPTVGGKDRWIEVNILDFSQDIYGLTLRVHLEAYLRPELHFDSLDALKAQIERDRVNTINILEP